MRLVAKGVVRAGAVWTAKGHFYVKRWSVFARL